MCHKLICLHICPIYSGSITAVVTCCAPQNSLFLKCQWKEGTFYLFVLNCFKLSQVLFAFATRQMPREVSCFHLINYRLYENEWVLVATPINIREYLTSESMVFFRAVSGQYIINGTTIHVYGGECKDQIFYPAFLILRKYWSRVLSAQSADFF